MAHQNTTVIKIRRRFLMKNCLFLHPDIVLKNWSVGRRGATLHIQSTEWGSTATGDATLNHIHSYSPASLFSSAFTQCLTLGLMAATVSMTTFGCRAT